MRVINFNSGPAALPLPALERARDELVDYEHTGMSIIEHSHRGTSYGAVHQDALACLKRLLDVPDSHHVLFLPGGASVQFAQVALNFLSADKSADYILTGTWSEKAYREAQFLGAVRVAASTKRDDGHYTRVPTQAELQLEQTAAYVHTTSNNTIFGTQFQTCLDTYDVPHVCDMSSDFLSRPIDVSRYGLIYAGAQKNCGPAGVLIIVAKKDFLAHGRSDIPQIFRYQTHLEANSMLNTPPTFAIYLMRAVLEWIEGQGGLLEMDQRNHQKATLLYNTLDCLCDFYSAPVEKASRSLMNIVFRCPTDALTNKFTSQAAQCGMVGLQGHRSMGGIRVSAYNAVSVEDITTLVSFMKSFAQNNG